MEGRSQRKKKPNITSMAFREKMYEELRTLGTLGRCPLTNHQSNANFLQDKPIPHPIKGPSTSNQAFNPSSFNQASFNM